MFSLYSNILAEGTPVDAEIAGYLRDGAAQVQTLLDGMSEFALAATELQFEPNPIPLDLVVLQALGQIRSEGSQATVTYAGLPAIQGNFAQLALLFRHLLKNAVQNSDNACEVSIGAELAGETWKIAVRDNGRGIEARYHERIFEPYFRLQGREAPGNGLGLAICSQIVRRSGGSIWVESEPGRGATFYFTLIR